MKIGRWLKRAFRTLFGMQDGQNVVLVQIREAVDEVLADVKEQLLDAVRDLAGSVVGDADGPPLMQRLDNIEDTLDEIQKRLRELAAPAPDAPAPDAPDPPA